MATGGDLVVFLLGLGLCLWLVAVVAVVNVDSCSML